MNTRLLPAFSLAVALSILLTGCGRSATEDTGLTQQPAPEAPVAASQTLTVESTPPAQPAPTSPARPPSFLDRYKFVGLAPIAADKKIIKAIVVDTETKQTYLLSAGETVNDATVREIRNNPPILVLERDQEIGLLELAQLPNAVPTQLPAGLTDPGQVTSVGADPTTAIAGMKPGAKHPKLTAPSSAAPGSPTPPLQAPNIVPPPPPTTVPPPPPTMIPPPPPPPARPAP